MEFDGIVGRDARRGRAKLTVFVFLAAVVLLVRDNRRRVHDVGLRMEMGASIDARRRVVRELVGGWKSKESILPRRSIEWGGEDGKDWMDKCVVKWSWIASGLIYHVLTVAVSEVR